MTTETGGEPRRGPLVDWPSTLVEVGLVLLGLLIAFSVDRLWEAHREHQREAEYVASLHDEFEANVLELDRLLAHQQEVVQAGRIILEAVAAPTSQKHFELAAAAVPAVFNFWPTRLQTATYDDLKNTGAIELIRDVELRTALARFDALLTSEVPLGDALVLEEFIHGVRPYLVETLTPDVYMSESLRTAVGIPRLPRAGSLETALRDPRFWNLVAQRMQFEWARTQLYMADLRSIASRIVELTAPGR
jgi:hypothetical protein